MVSRTQFLKKGETADRPSGSGGSPTSNLGHKGDLVGAGLRPLGRNHQIPSIRRKSNPSEARCLSFFTLRGNRVQKSSGHLVIG